jgi:hypothetical protein
VLCLRDRLRTLLPVCIDGTLLNNSDNVRTNFGSDIVIGTRQFEWSFLGMGSED